MAADTYIRTAITQLQTALTDLSNQMQGSQNDAKTQRKQIESDIHKLEQERNVHNTEMNHDLDDNQRRAVHDRIQKIDRDIAEHHAQISRMDADISSLVQRKTKAYNSLKNLSGQLSRIIASPDLR